MTTVHVTGVAGFLGSAVARRLLLEGHFVTGNDSFITSRLDAVPRGVVFYPRETQVLPPPNAEVVVHCAAIARSAWPNDDDLWVHNVQATRTVTHRWPGAVIFASSSVVAHPHSSTYARTKAVAERMVLNRGGVALRFGNIYGPGQSQEGFAPNVIPAMRRHIAKHGTVRVDGDGSQRRHFVHIDDAVDAVARAIAAPSSNAGLWFDIAGESLTILELAERFGRPIVHGPSRGDPLDIPQDSTPAKYLLGWEPKVALRDGLARVVEWAA